MASDDRSDRAESGVLALQGFCASLAVARQPRGRPRRAGAMAGCRLPDWEGGPNVERPSEGRDVESSFRYAWAQPCALLRSSVARFWQIESVDPRADSPGRWALPDGGSEWVFVLGDPLSRDGVVHGAGAHAAGTVQAAYLSRPVGRLLTFGVAFHPGGASMFTPVPADQLVGSAVALEHLWGGCALHLAEQLARARGFSARVDLVQRALLEHWRPIDAEVSAALRRLKAQPGLAIRTLAADTASARRLERKFLRHVGVPPKRLARMFRLQLAVRLWLDGEVQTQSDLAASAGYSDQSHMVREFRALAGAPPQRALERERGMSYSFKTDTR